MLGFAGRGPVLWFGPAEAARSRENMIGGETLAA